jgi:transcriptional regulator with XRE-family HTH domain
MDGRDLKQRRMMMSMSQEQLAKRLGVSQNAISRWEGGKVAIRHDGILLLAMLYLEQERAAGRDQERGDDNG